MRVPRSLSLLLMHTSAVNRHMLQKDLPSHEARILMPQWTSEVLLLICRRELDWRRTTAECADKSGDWSCRVQSYTQGVHVSTARIALH